MVDDSQVSSGTSTASTDTSNTDATNTQSNDGTAENVKNNDVEKNKKYAEIRMMEELRSTYQLKIDLPRVPIGVSSGMFFFMPVIDEFYEKNYGELMKIVADKKFARYAGFEKGRFYVEKVEEKHGFTRGCTLTVNPLAPSLGQWSQMMVEAEKALIQAVNEAQNSQTTGSVDSTTGGGGIAGLTTMTGKDCSETYGISTRSFDISKTANHLIGNSSANYAVDTANMTAREALMDVYNRFRYSGYSDNRTCPQKMWNKSGTIRGNCADIARLEMCLGQVHGLKIGIRHCPNHYYNLIELDGKTYRFDCCFKSRGYTSAHYGGELCNNLSMNGGPWSR
ncbi:MAG: hypothetical protein BZ136_07520 [Methanosphaera sp. rholeuAM74]|nr:MAG: hypothetical protein BZ136_07520 [Methanosphaera sp. rholeuAM74]